MDLKANKLSLISKAYAVIFMSIAFFCNGLLGWALAYEAIVAIGLAIANVYVAVDISKIKTATKGEDASCGKE